MDADGLPLIGPGIDLTKVEAIHQKRTLAFLNHFVTHTARFLNRFSCVCEEKLATLAVRIQRLETTMNILEAKLSSIPGLENVKAPTPSTTQATTATTQNAPASQPSTSASAETDNKPQQSATTEPEEEIQSTPAPEPTPPQNTVSQDPTYLPFFKMAKMGVPDMAVKQKMVMAGLDPNFLDTPDAPAPGGGAAPSTQDDSDDDFSDKGSDSGESSVDFSD